MKHNPNLTTYAQNLRKNLTKEEKELWYKFLRNYPVQFRRQVTVGNYILDFYCAYAKLAIEVDGSQHFTEDGKRCDEKRTAYLDKLGIRVLRYTNWNVMTNLRNVCHNIDMEVYKRIQELYPQ